MSLGIGPPSAASASSPTMITIGNPSRFNDHGSLQARLPAARHTHSHRCRQLYDRPCLSQSHVVLRAAHLQQHVTHMEKEVHSLHSVYVLCNSHLCFAAPSTLTCYDARMQNLLIYPLCPGTASLPFQSQLLCQLAAHSVSRHGPRRLFPTEHWPNRLLTVLLEENDITGRNRH